MTPAIAEWARLTRFLRSKKFTPFPYGWVKYGIVVERSGPCQYNIYRGTNGEAHWNVTAEKIKELLAAG